MSMLKTPTSEEIHAWGWEIGAEAGHSLANEGDAFIGITVRSVDAPDALQIYARAYLRALVCSYRTELARLLIVRSDVAANVQSRLSSKIANNDNRLKE